MYVGRKWVSHDDAGETLPPKKRWALGHSRKREGGGERRKGFKEVMRKSESFLGSPKGQKMNGREREKAILLGVFCVSHFALFFLFCLCVGTRQKKRRNEL